MGIFSITQVTVSIFLLFLKGSSLYSNLLLFPSNANDERVNGSLPIQQNGTGPCQGKGTGNGCGVESLEDGLGKKACLVGASLR